MKRTAICGVLIALAMIFSYIESLLPLPVPMPGIKIGLANLVVVFALFKLDYKYAFLISLIRVVLIGFIFTNMSAMLYGLAGAVLSLIVMVISYKTLKLHVITVSVLGAVAHIAGQMIVAGFITDFGAVMYYAPYLFIASFLAGIVIGTISNILISRILIDMN